VRRWRWVGTERVVLLVATGLGLYAAGCSSESDKAPGVLMLALTTDLEVPKDFDEVLVKVQPDGAKEPKCKLLSWSGSEAEPATQLASVCRGGIETAELKLPATVGIESRKTKDATVTVTAFRGSESVFCQSFKATGLPTAGDGTVPMKRVDISWLETKEAGEPGSCSGPADKLLVSELPTFSEKAIFGGAEGECFDTLAAVQGASRLKVTLGDNDSCSVDGGDPGRSLLWVKPAGSMGICGRAACFVPVDAETVDSWPTTPKDLQLPVNVCPLIGSGEIRAVLAVPKGDAKTVSTPTCGAWSSVTSKPGTTEDPLPLARELLAYWNIDEGEGSTWLDATYQGHDLTLHGGKGGPSYATTRVGGRGFAAQFTGVEYAELPMPDAAPLESQTFTVSAWVSLGPDDIDACTDATQPLISTRSGCDGYELGIRCSKEAGGTRPSAVFAYGCDGQGDPEELVRPLPKNSGQWTGGDWYHLAATYAYDEADGGHAALFLDGMAEAESADAAKLTFSGDAPFEVGKGFHGYVDDVLVFGRALDGETLRRLYETSATVQGPSGMRWGTWDATGSVASLGEQSQQGDLRVDVAEAHTCSSGGAVAHLSDTQVEQLAYGADRAVLDADITAVRDDTPPWFEFSLSGPHGRPQCTWYGVVNDSSHYEFDLKRPNWCANSDACAIDPSSVRTATISTHWKNIDPLALSIKSLEFRPGSAEWLWKSWDERSDGVSLCWRPVTYEPTPVASALWHAKSGGGNAWDDPTWSVLLAGEPGSNIGSTAEVAGFVAGGLPLDLSNCQSMDITLDSSPTDPDIEITIEDATGMACQHHLGSGSSSVLLDESNAWQCNSCANSGGSDTGSVRAATTRIAVRKTWGNPILLNEPIELKTVTISFPNGCAVPAK
jgi:hypothetical protein